MIVYYLPENTVNLKPYRVTSLIRHSAPLGPYSRTMHGALWWPRGGGLFLMSEVPLSTPYPKPHTHKKDFSCLGVHTIVHVT